MTDVVAGQVVVNILAEASVKQIEAELKKAIAPLKPEIIVTLKLAPGQVTSIKKQADAQLAKLKNKPELTVGLKLAKGAAAKAVRQATADFKELKRPPKLGVELGINATTVRRAIAEANARLKAAKGKTPKVNIELNLSTTEMEAIKEIKVLTKRVEAEVLTDPIDLRVDLDEKAQAALLAKVALLREKAELAGYLAAKSAEDKLLLNSRRVAGQRTLIEARAAAQRMLINERANTAIKNNNSTSLRVLRNDLSQFDASMTRTIRKLGLGFSIFTAVVVGSFAAIATAATVQFAKVEAAATRASSIFASSDIAALDQAKVTSEQILSINRAIRQDVIDTSREVAVATKFDTEQIAEGFRFLAGAGVELDASLSAMPTVAQFAQAGFIELEDASELLAQGFIAQGGDVRRFGEDITGLADKMTFVAQTAPITMEEALKAFANNSAASFKAFGQSADEALNIIGLLGRTGVKGLTAGTQAAILVREISRSAFDKAPAVFKKYGIQVRDAEGKARSFSAVLDELTTVFRQQTNDFTDPRAFTLLKKEFALTEKSSRAFQQVLPAVKNLQDNARGASGELAKLQEQSTGRLATQTKVVTDTLSFQFEQIINNVQNLGSVFAEKAGRSIVDFLKEMNGEVEGSTSLFEDLEKKATEFGDSFAKAMGSALDQLGGQEGKDFFGGIVELYRGTLTGLRDAFRAFRSEVFGEGSDRGFFSVLGSVFEGIGNFARTALPKIGKAFGFLVQAIRGNPSLAEVLAKATLALFIFSKTLRLIIVPIGGVIGKLGELRVGVASLAGASLASTITGWTASINSLVTAVPRAIAALNGLAAAQTAVAASQAVAGAGAASVAARGAGAAAGSGTAASALAGVGALAAPRTLKGVTKIRALLGTLAPTIKPFLSALGKLSLVVTVVAGAVLGFVKEMKRTASADKEFAASLADMIPILKTIGRIVFDVIGVVFRLGETLGRLAATTLRTAIVSLGDFVRGIKALLRGDFTGAGKAFADVIFNALVMPFKLAASAILDVVADLVGAVEHVPFLGGKAKEAVKSIRGAAEATRDFKMNMSGASDEAEKVAKSVTKVKDAAKVATKISADLRHEIALSHIVAQRAAEQSDLAGKRGVYRSEQLRAQLQTVEGQFRINGFVAAESFRKIQESQSHANEAMRIGEQQQLRQRIAARANFNESSIFADQQIGVFKKQEEGVRQLTMVEQMQASMRRQEGERLLRQIAAQTSAVAGTGAAYVMSSAAARTALNNMATGASKVQGPTLGIVDALNLGRNEVVAYKVDFDTMTSAAEEDFRRIQIAARDTTSYLHSLNAAMLAGMGNAAASMNNIISAAERDLMNNPNVTRALRRSVRQGVSDRAAIAAAKEARRQGEVVAKALGDGDVPEITPPDTTAAVAAVKEVKTAAEQATEAVNKLSQSQLNKQAAALVGKITKVAAGGYKATAREAEILRRVLPGVEAQLESQKNAVAKLDEALQSLQGTQLKGTQAFNKQAFEFDQQVKQLQLQRLDLIMAGTSDQDPLIAALDAQISAIQQQSERAQLAFDIDTAPLQKKLEEMFNPVKELSFDQIAEEFKKLGGQKAPLIDAIAGGENLKAALDATIKDADARFGDAGKQVTLGFVGGITKTLPEVNTAGKKTGDAALAGVNNVMQFGSPSRTMIQRGVWVNEGFISGINSTLPGVQRAGVDTMWGFLEGMRNVYTNRVQPFVLQIAEWIKDNKGPIAYDRTLLRPAGQAMMEGFSGGLRDGFGEIQSWVRQVGPSLANDSFPKELFVKRSARFLINNAKVDSTFNPDDAFGDLLYGIPGMAGGDFPANLSFLHKTLSSADTLDMANRLANIYGTPISDFLRAPGTRTTTGNISDHTQGTAVDFSNGSNPTQEMDALYAAINPLLGKIFKQILYRTNVGGNHFNHVHAAWMKGEGFGMNSGKKGVGMLNIPGVGADVQEAIAYASQAVKMDPLLIAAVMKQESGFRKNVISPDGGYGLMQLTSQGLVSKADSLGGRLNPRVNALVGSQYLRDLINQLGSVKLGLSAYNSGPGGGERFGRVDVPAYVSSVMRFFEEFKRKFGNIGNYRAQGGNMNAGTAYHVNERGNELFVPGRGGTMISAKDFRDMVTALQSGGSQQSSTVVNDNRTVNVSSNSNSPAVVRALVDSRMRSQIVGIRK